MSDHQMNDSRSPASRAAFDAIAAADLSPANDNRSPWQRLADTLRWNSFVAWLRQDVQEAYS